MPKRLTQDLRNYAGRWIAWDRTQTRILATGDTFDEVKTAAAEQGEQSVLVAKVPKSRVPLRRTRSLLNVFAVFIALSQSATADAGKSARRDQSVNEVGSSTLETDDSKGIQA